MFSRLHTLSALVCLAAILAGSVLAQAPGTAKTLRSLGAVGDGKTDDRAALQTALNQSQGAPVDGEGLTYAVRGNIDVRGSVDLRNAKLVQTMDPADTTKFMPKKSETARIKLDPPTLLRAMVKGLPVMNAEGVGLYAEDPIPTEAELQQIMPSIALRTLAISGDNGKLISVRLGKVTIDRGKHPQTGGRNDGCGLRVDYASPVQLIDVEITGDGKGAGLGISNCAKVKLERVNIHDMNWAPYSGDDVLEKLTTNEVRDLFGWNNFPIYEYRANLKRFARVRVQEQIAGMFVSLSEDVEILDTKVERLQARIGKDLYPMQADGMTINRVKNIVIRGCTFSKVWEGIDFTGGGGSDFVFENNVAYDVLGWSFKIAHPKQNGKIINCRSERSGLSGFIIGGKSENILVSNCQALETGANRYWVTSAGKPLMTLAGIRIDSDGTTSPLPMNIRVENCSAINTKHAGAIEFGLLCEADPQKHNVSVSGFKAEGYNRAAIHGIENNATPAAPAAAKSAEQVKWESIVHPKYLTWPAMKYVEGKPGLPNVLIIGDSISIGYTAAVRDALAGKANVYRIPTNGGATVEGLQNIDKWLSWRDHWDVIHFNWGLHDLKRQKEGSKNPDQLDVTGKINVPVEQYAANLDQLVKRMQKTGAKLIFANTTPVPAGAMGRPTEAVPVYNAAAEKVMRANNVPIDDLFGFITPKLAEAQVPPDVHFTSKGYQLLGGKVAEEIMAALAAK